MAGSCAGLCLRTQALGGEEPLPSVFPANSFFPLAGEALLQTLAHRCCTSQVPCWALLSQAPEPRPDCSSPHLPSPPPAPAPGPLHPAPLSLLFSELPPVWLHRCDNEVSATERSGLGRAKQQARGLRDRLEQAWRLPQLALESTRCPHWACQPQCHPRPHCLDPRGQGLR